MVLRLNIHRIELATRDWICKVQIVEMGRPRESPDKKCRFQNLILEDEKECQIKAVMYADEIEQYADKLKLINTYLISTARVKVSPTSYGKSIHNFYWILDKETVIEHIKPSNELEKPLPPPTKLNIITFDRIPHLMVDSATEIDRETFAFLADVNQFLSLIINTFSIYWQSFFVVVLKNMQVAVIIGVKKLPFVTISEYKISPSIFPFSANILNQSDCNPRKKYRNLYFSRAKENKTMLLSHSSRKPQQAHPAPHDSHSSPTTYLSLKKSNQGTFIGVFYVEAEMAILDKFQEFCVLECSGCKQKKRTKDRKDFDCPKCNRKTALVPRCIFQIDLINGTTTTTKIYLWGEKLLSMTAEGIFDITCTKRQSLSLDNVHQMLSNKVFQIELRKSSWGSSNSTHATLSILSYMEKEHTPQTTTDRNSKKLRPLEISEVDVIATTTAAGSSNATPTFEPPTPTKKL
ncbi:hypothetical protein H5410_041513 [Solanum commersonii]|uniref:Replication factor A C-terminal domain-containing protein n=1 Tax=Solanum commersonii TaxID=4109 RepID=A0A9J5XTU0_SOLCO|nr:hypothetical protein H5410_041513 [Solanum commersonii]